jgi:MarR family transcriptional regulator for hemolysin
MSYLLTHVVTVDELEKAGLAERRPSSRDRRARVISVTEAGVT